MECLPLPPCGLGTDETWYLVVDENDDEGSSADAASGCALTCLLQRNRSQFYARREGTDWKEYTIRDSDGLVTHCTSACLCSGTLALGTEAGDLVLFACETLCRAVSHSPPWGSAGSSDDDDGDNVGASPGLAVPIFGKSPVVDACHGMLPRKSGSPSRILWLLGGDGRIVHMDWATLRTVCRETWRRTGTRYGSGPRTVIPFHNWSAGGQRGLSRLLQVPLPLPTFWDTLLDDGESTAASSRPVPAMRYVDEEEGPVGAGHSHEAGVPTEQEISLLIVGTSPLLCVFTADLGSEPPVSLGALAAEVADSVRTAMTSAVRHVGRNVADLLPTRMSTTLVSMGRGLLASSWLRLPSTAPPPVRIAAAVDLEDLSDVELGELIAAQERQLMELRGQPARRLVCDFEFNDESKRVVRVALCPGGALALATDAIGRVLMVDTRDLCVLRLWKGYRDAQCGWVTDVESGTSHPVIYSPRRQAVEMWQGRNGPRLVKIAVTGGTLVARPHARGGATSCLLFAPAAASTPSSTASYGSTGASDTGATAGADGGQQASREVTPAASVIATLGAAWGSTHAHLVLCMRHAGGAASATCYWQAVDPHASCAHMPDALLAHDVMTCIDLNVFARYVADGGGDVPGVAEA